MEEYSDEMERFQKHLFDVLPMMECGEDIATLVLNISIEYDDWKEELINEQLSRDEDEQTREDDLADYNAATKL